MPTHWSYVFRALTHRYMLHWLGLKITKISIAHKQHGYISSMTNHPFGWQIFHFHLPVYYVYIEWEKLNDWSLYCFVSPINVLYQQYLCCLYLYKICQCTDGAANHYLQCSRLSWKSCQSWSEFWEIQTLICKEMCKKLLVLTKSCRSQTDGPALVSNTDYLNLWWPKSVCHIDGLKWRNLAPVH